MYVIKCISVVSPRLNEGFFFSGDSRQNAQIQQGTAHRDQLAPLLMRAERERKAEDSKLRLCSELEQFLAEQQRRGDNDS